ncbi:hypothetical protein AGMMS50249_2710 [candidate division SR1 bacterium]|nr:hypothetical protein AGMMS50249_2710 [candidate division SR1 bacterium]
MKKIGIILSFYLLISIQFSFAIDEMDVINDINNIGFNSHLKDNTKMTRGVSTHLIYELARNYFGYSSTSDQPISKCNFKDVTQTDNNLNLSIFQVCNMGIMQGTSEKKFYPNNYLTNAEAVTILMRLVYGEQKGGTIHRSEPYYRLANNAGLLQTTKIYSKFAPITFGEFKNIAVPTVMFIQKEARLEYTETPNNYSNATNSTNLDCAENIIKLKSLAKSQFTGDKLAEVLEKIDQKCN